MSLKDRMLAVMADVQDQVAEREELVEAIAIALLTRKNLFILGEPGQAKSYAINQFRERIIGARQFERLLSKQTDEEQLFGRIDLSSLIPGGVPQSVLDRNPEYQDMYGRLKARLACGKEPGDLPERMERQRKALAVLYGGEPQVNTAGKIPEADICFCDEIFKCNDGVLNSLLTAFNERKYTNEGVTYPIPVISFFAASNEIPNFNDPAEKILAALYDRLELKVKTENIQERANRLSVLKSKQSGAVRGPVKTITLDELLAMQAEVQAVTVPDAINELADDILCDLRSKGVVISDRKFLGYTSIAQAKAWLNGHAAVESTDLLALKCYLWHLPAERETVFDVLDRFCNNPLQEKINEIRAEAAEALESFNAAGTENGTKALIKLRGEYVRLYQDHQALEAKAQSDAERGQLEELLADLDKNLKTAHDRMSFTHISLKELAVLQ